MKWGIPVIDEEHQELLLETITNTMPIPLRQIYAARIEDNYND
ncbi:MULTISPECIES: hypothetical protein [Lysinibacillus]|nr:MULTISPECIES: hypothetical protein [Lysinibacillus]